jgi:alanine racemase
MTKNSKTSFIPVVRIDLSALKQNVRNLKKQVGKTKLCCVVKADAYGHGIVEVSKAAIEAGAGCLAVATILEGIQLRKAGLSCPILLLSEPTLDEFEPAIKYGLTLTIISVNSFITLTKIIEKLNRLKNSPNSKYNLIFGSELDFGVKELFKKRSDKVPIHLKLETGMVRLGGRKEELMEILSNDQNLVMIEACWTHMATADIKNHQNNLIQLKKYDEFIYEVKKNFKIELFSHIANTAAGLSIEDSLRDMVRFGIGIYGYYPSKSIKDIALSSKNKLVLKPVKSLVAKVENLISIERKQGVSYGHNYMAEIGSLIAVVQIGYADGLFRILSKMQGEVLICGTRCKIVGNITMNHIMVDVTALKLNPNLKIGTEVVILGSQKKDFISKSKVSSKAGTTESAKSEDFETIDADEIADKLDTISYEVLTNLGHTFKKEYIN